MMIRDQDDAARLTPRRFMRRLGKVLRSCRATAAIEFAFALPVLCAMVFALYEVTQGVICYMKVVDVANTVGDLLGQTTTAQGGVGNTDFDNYYIAAQLVMTNSTGNNLGLAIANVYYDATGKNPAVSWQVERGGAAAMANAATFVNGLGTANGSTIVIKATYTYTSLLNYFITTPIVISTQIAAQPRNLLPPAYTQGTPCPPASGSESCS
ncbi:MAG TPA: TadE/TadG family type IV pilus assembly protein [Stellaceae bacterium]|nr:TadE/TadG family type IV pilus assembly protein [Stellaceae bacterium]